METRLDKLTSTPGGESGWHRLHDTIRQAVLLTATLSSGIFHEYPIGTKL